MIPFVVLPRNYKPPQPLSIISSSLRDKSLGLGTQEMAKPRGTWERYTRYGAIRPRSRGSELKEKTILGDVEEAIVSETRGEGRGVK